MSFFLENYRNVSRYENNMVVKKALVCSFFFLDLLTCIEFFLDDQ